jgi:DNA polymerase III subunit epsilon
MGKKKSEPRKRTRPEFVTFTKYAAIDFETADYGRDSACAVAVVVIDSGKIVNQACTLIRPPRREFVFSYLHGITWEHVSQKPTFADAWPQLSVLLEGVDFIAAHNASFDRGVINACCARGGLKSPVDKFLCTMRLSRHLWGIRPTKLSDVCRHFGIPLNHHDAASDALACAKIVSYVGDKGVPSRSFLSSSEQKRLSV